MLYVTYLHDVLYVCTSSICFCSPKGTIMKIRSILTCIMLSLPQYLNGKPFRCVYCFCKVVFYTHLLYLFFVVANKYLLTYQLSKVRGKNLLRMFPQYFRSAIYKHAKKPLNGEPVFDKRKLNKGRPRKLSVQDERIIIWAVLKLREEVG